jgi:hypothetical protein
MSSWFTQLLHIWYTIFYIVFWLVEKDEFQRTVLKKDFSSIKERETRVKLVSKLSVLCFKKEKIVRTCVVFIKYA